MEESEIRRMIRQEVRQVLAPILLATVVENKDHLRSTIRRFASDSPMPGVRQMKPFGISSRAPAGTDCLAVPVAGDSSHVNQVTEFDRNRPEVDDGETALYAQAGQLVHLDSAGNTKVGSKTADEPAVLGNVFKEWAGDLIDAILAIQYVGNLGAPVTGTLNAADFTALQNELADLLALKIFVERGA